jgi:flagella basal body P-ring formation protein FlgA
VLLLTVAISRAAPATSWTLVLRDQVTLPVAEVKLAKLVAEPVPAAAGQLVVLGAARPGSTVEVDRRLVLRRLVEAGLANNVRCAGALCCRVIFRGQALSGGEVVAWLEDQLTAWLPASPPVAPPPWLEVELRMPPLAVTGQRQLALVEPRRLQAGRNLVPFKIVDGERTTRLTATVLCHLHGEVARAKRDLQQDEQATPELFVWEWQDLCGVERGVVVGREALGGQSMRRSVSAGRLLRVLDLEETPAIRQGDPVELYLHRGEVWVTVRARARQDGRLGQIITVRNELNGKLVTGRVTGPGVVEWRR